MTEPGEPSAYTFSQEVNVARERVIADRFREFNSTHSNREVDWGDPRYPPSPLHLYVLDGDGGFIGGVIGRTNQIPTWFEISSLWVDEVHRGKGLGRQLVKRAEEEARARGCRYARLATSDFQAPGFYEKLGYRRYGTLANCPPGETVYYYWKDLLTEG